MNHYASLLVLILATGFSTVQANSMHSTITQSAADATKYSLKEASPEQQKAFEGG